MKDIALVVCVSTNTQSWSLQYQLSHKICPQSTGTSGSHTAAACRANSDFTVLFADVAPEVHTPDKSSSKTPPYKAQRGAINSGCASMTNAENNLRCTKQYAYPCKDVSAKTDLEKTSVPSTLPHGHREHGPTVLIEFKQQNAPRHPVALVQLDLASQQHVALEQCGSQSS